MLYALDIETCCDVTSCIGYNGSSACEHALSPFTGRITVIGVWSPTSARVFRDLQAFTNWVLPTYTFVAQNGKFDFKFLLHFGALTLHQILAQWTDDTQLAAYTSLTKIPAIWLEQYEAARKKLKGKHRKAGRHSLKTLAPYFLGVPAFWEADDKDNDEYVLTDAKYTYQLHEFFQPVLQEEGLLAFYTDHMMPWVKLLLRAEARGISLDMTLLTHKWDESKRLQAELKGKLDKLWAPAYEAWADLKRKALRKEYDDMFWAAVNKKPLRSEQLVVKYETLYQAALLRLDITFNLDSPAQLKWLLRDFLQLNIIDFEGDESTGKEVLKRLAAIGREDVKLFLEYRKHAKLAAAFFPSYSELQRNGVLHCSFNVDITKTGRLSSSGPNLQQVPGDLHSLFVARPGYKLVTRDAAAIEPRFIAYFTEDKNLCDLILRNGDFHSNNAIIMCELNDCLESDVKERYPRERGVSKTNGLAGIYGSGPKRTKQISMQAGFDWTQAKCKSINRNLRNYYHEVFEVKEQLDIAALYRPITNFFGRKRRFEARDIHMQALNSWVQSSASDLILEGAHRAQDQFDLREIDAHLLLLVHDEAVFECPDDRLAECEEIIERCLTQFELPTKYGLIPLKVEGKTAREWSK